MRIFSPFNPFHFTEKNTNQSEKKVETEKLLK